MTRPTCPRHPPRRHAGPRDRSLLRERAERRAARRVRPRRARQRRPLAARLPRAAAAGLRCIAVDWPLGSHELPAPGRRPDPARRGRPRRRAPGGARPPRRHRRRQRQRRRHHPDPHHPEPRAHRPRRAHPVGLVREVLPAAVRGPPDRGPRARRCPGPDPVASRAMGAAAADRVRAGSPSDPMPDDVVDSFLAPSRERREIRQDLTRFLRGVIAGTRSRRPNSSASSTGRCCSPGRPRTGSSRSPWPSASPSGCRTRRSRRIDDSLTFVPLDQPEVLADLIVDFVGRDAAA